MFDDDAHTFTKKIQLFHYFHKHNTPRKAHRNFLYMRSEKQQKRGENEFWVGRRWNEIFELDTQRANQSVFDVIWLRLSQRLFIFSSFEAVVVGIM